MNKYLKCSKPQGQPVCSQPVLCALAESRESTRVAQSHHVFREGTSFLNRFTNVCVCAHTCEARKDSHRSSCTKILAGLESSLHVGAESHNSLPIRCEGEKNTHSVYLTETGSAHAGLVYEDAAERGVPLQRDGHLPAGPGKAQALSNTHEQSRSQHLPVSPGIRGPGEHGGGQATDLRSPPGLWGSQQGHPQMHTHYQPPPGRRRRLAFCRWPAGGWRAWTFIRKPKR